MNTEALIPKDWKRVAFTFTFFISACTTVPPLLPAASEFRLILDSVSAELR
jgi:starvation-inducible outer membrane lipoprotein